MDRLEHELAGEAQVVRLEVHAPVPRELALRFRVSVVPTFIILDSEGHERWRQGGEFPNRDVILKTLRALSRPGV